jgi:hypothetical protein
MSSPKWTGNTRVLVCIIGALLWLKIFERQNRVPNRLVETRH